MRFLCSLLVLTSAFFVSSCGTRGACSAASCMGCCTRDGRCVGGTEPNACGRSGSSCNACVAGQVCSNGACGVPGSGTGGGSAAGGPASGGGTSNTTPGGGTSGTGGGTGGTTGGGGAEACSEDAKLVYVIDSDGTLLSFNPKMVGTPQAFTEKGQLACSRFGSVFSMGVDRDAKAWVVYTSGDLFRVDVNTLQCTPIPVNGPPNAEIYGMGFVTDAPGSTKDTLFIAGNAVNSMLESSQFGTLSTTAPYDISIKAMLAGSPELTGTGDAHLWAFTPNTSPPKVSELNKLDGKALRTFDAPSLQGAPRAWAFAFWGGDFWIFLMKGLESDTTVYRMNGSTGAITVAMSRTGRQIVGAGVSTCAPIMIQ